MASRTLLDRQKESTREPVQFLLHKDVHIFSVAASFALFVVRGFWAFRGYPRALEAWVRLLPHMVDAVLLTSALAMLYLQEPKGWPGDRMTVKGLLLTAYVVLSSLLLKWSGAKNGQICRVGDRVVRVSVHSHGCRASASQGDFFSCDLISTVPGGGGRADLPAARRLPGKWGGGW
jgi:uncharacterized membrane protein SirB2